jgi:hypothetical protein
MFVFGEGIKMIRMVVTSRVGDDGVLHVSVPLGESEANREVKLTIESASTKPMTHEERSTLIASLAGSWQGEFERPESLEPEERDSL